MIPSAPRSQSHYSAPGIEERLLKALREAGLDPDRRLAPEALGALDHFHSGGRRATRELLELANIRPEERVLDVGAGLGGAARSIAARGNSVVCLEPSRDYCSGAALLNRLTGLDDRIEVRQGDALEMPFADAAFEVVWMQNVGMNIADKARLYAQIRRVLKPGGRFVFQEIAAGDGPAAYFPLPWAGEPRDSHLASPAEIRSGLERSRFAAERFEDLSEAELSLPPVRDQGPLTLAVFVDSIGEKARNSRRNLEEGRVRLVRGVFRAI